MLILLLCRRYLPRRNGLVQSFRREVLTKRHNVLWKFRDEYWVVQGILKVRLGHDKIPLIA